MDFLNSLAVKFSNNLEERINARLAFLPVSTSSINSCHIDLAILDNSTKLNLSEHNVKTKLDDIKLDLEEFKKFMYE